MNWGKIGQENDRGGQDIEDDHDDQIGEFSGSCNRDYIVDNFFLHHKAGLY